MSFNGDDILSEKKIGNIPVFEEIKFEECCGCEACVNVCPKKIIGMQQNEEGFYYPIINQEECIRCGLCKRTCPIIVEKSNKGMARLESYAGSSLDNEIIKKSASGGMFSLIVDEWLHGMQEKGYICGVIYDEDYKGVHHIMTEEMEDVFLMRTSKYVQSKKGYIYQQVKHNLEKGKRVLFSGTPCEVAALYSYLGKRPNNLLTVDIICQGPTAPKVLKEYTELLEKKYASKVLNMNMRHKEGIWIPQYLLVQMESGRIIKNLFYDTPLGAALHIMQRQSCYKCKFVKKHKYSDITIGDYHGADKEENYYNPNGTSIIIGNTETGIRLIEKIREKRNVYLERKEFSEIAETNIRLIDTWDQLSERKKFVKYFSEYGIEMADKKTRNKSIREKLIRCLPINIKQNILNIKQKRNKKVSM